MNVLSRHAMSQFCYRVDAVKRVQEIQTVSTRRNLSLKIYFYFNKTPKATKAFPSAIISAGSFCIQWKENFFSGTWTNHSRCDSYFTAKRCNLIRFSVIKDGLICRHNKPAVRYYTKIYKKEWQNFLLHLPYTSTFYSKHNNIFKMNSFSIRSLFY